MLIFMHLSHIVRQGVVNAIASSVIQMVQKTAEHFPSAFSLSSQTLAQLSRVVAAKQILLILPNFFIVLPFLLIARSTRDKLKKRSSNQNDFETAAI